MKKFWLALGISLLTSLSARAQLEIVSPASDATVLSATPWLEIRGCGPLPASPELMARLDGAETPLDWRKSPYSGRWLAPLPLLSTGHHTIQVSGHCSWLSSARGVQTHRFEIASWGADVTAPALGLARHYVAQNPAPAQAWDWGPGVLLYGMDRFARDSHEELEAYVLDYQKHWALRGAPAPDRSDSCPPALTGLSLARDRGDWIGIDGALAVADYLRNEPRNRLGSLNHLGHSFVSHFFPKSIWVDSLMMMAVFSAQWGDFVGDEALKDFGLAQPAIFASVLQDPATGLFRHAWKTKSGAPIPETDAFWLRGNGWVLVSIAELLEHVRPDSAQARDMIRIFRKTADGLIAYQQPTGLWDMIANLPGFSYPETSGTALVAYALARGVHRGWLPPSYLAPAKAAFAGVTAMLLPELDGRTLPWTSGATNPGPRWTYGLIGSVNDASYGVGAYLLAASEMTGEIF
jgi:unsaturated rhamnogalacturonyl hydrolase